MLTFPSVDQTVNFMLQNHTWPVVQFSQLFNDVIAEYRTFIFFFDPLLHFLKFYMLHQREGLHCIPSSG
ncbi:hypothetical protein PGB90_008149 [Kerria lacca]